MLDWIVSWNLTYLVHSTVLLGVALLAERFVSKRVPAVLDAIWKTALVGGLVTATLQIGFVRAGGLEPLGGSWRLASEPAAAVAAAELSGVSRAGDETLSRSGGNENGESRAAAHPGSRDARGVPNGPENRTTAFGLALLVGVWAAGAAVLLAVLGLSWNGLRRRLADRRYLREGVLASFLERLIEHTPRARPAGLAVSGRIEIPLAWGLRRREICLPERLVESMPRERQELVLAHELAHHERRDPLWLLVARVVESLWFFQPLNRLARRRLQEMAEYLCDDWAVERTGRPVSLARCLTEVAEWRLAATGPWPAPTLAAERNRLARRVSRLLDRAYPMPLMPCPRWLGTVLGVGLVGVALVAPGVSAAIEEQLPPERAWVEGEGAPEPRPAPPARMAPAPKPAPEPAPVSEAPRAVLASVGPAPVASPAPLALEALEAPDSPPVQEAPPAPPASPAPPAPPAPGTEQGNGGWVILDEEVRGFDALAEMEPELEARIEELSARLAEMAEGAIPSPEAIARIEAVSRRIAERVESDAARAAEASHIEAIEALAERLEAAGEDPELEKQLRAEVRALVEAVKPSADELRHLHEEMRRELERARPDREEMRHLQEELSGELRRLRARTRDQARAAAEARRGELERYRREARSQTREQTREELHQELDRLRAELDRLRAEMDRPRK